MQLYTKLKPWQIEPFERLSNILESGRNAIDMSDTGTGKTFVACAVACRLNVPTLAVVPKIAVTQWQRVMREHFGDSISVVNYEALRSGCTPFGRWQNNPPKAGTQHRRYFVCQSCQRKVDPDDRGDKCYCHPLGIHCLVTKKESWSYGRFVWAKEVEFIIFDEAHRCGGMNSRNADILIGAHRQRKKILCLSATTATSPLKMKALGYALGIHEDGNNFYNWLRRNGVGRLPNLPGLRWVVGRDKQLEIMATISRALIPTRGVRVRTADIPNFPLRHITAHLFDTDNKEAVNRLYRQMDAPLRRLKERMDRDVAAEHPLTEMLRAHQKIELLKVPLLAELAEDYVEKGHSVGVFVNFTETLKELRALLKGSLVIDGSTNGPERDAAVDAFGADEARTILVNSAAGGICINLQDKRGEFPRVGLINPGFCPTIFRQVCGRFHREGAKSPCFYRVVLLADTLEERIYKNLTGKLDNLDRLNQDDFLPSYS